MQHAASLLLLPPSLLLPLLLLSSLLLLRRPRRTPAPGCVRAATRALSCAATGLRVMQVHGGRWQQRQLLVQSQQLLLLVGVLLPALLAVHSSSCRHSSSNGAKQSSNRRGGIFDAPRTAVADGERLSCVMVLVLCRGSQGACQPPHAQRLGRPAAAVT